MCVAGRVMTKHVRGRWTKPMRKHMFHHLFTIMEFWIKMKQNFGAEFGYCGVVSWPAQLNCGASPLHIQFTFNSTSRATLIQGRTRDDARSGRLAGSRRRGGC